MSNSRKTWTDTDLIKSVSESKSIAEVIRSLGLIPAGGNYKTIEDRIKSLGLDISHFTGKGWNIGLKFKPNPPIPLDEILIENSSYHYGYRIKTRLIKEGKKEHRCDSCGLDTWQGEPIPLELHHKNGINTDNRFENLQLLCPNCHALTDNYRGKNIRKHKSASNESSEVESP